MGNRILVVEDNAAHRMMMQDFLELRGYRVFSLPNGEQFLEQVAIFKPEIILMDLKLPGVDGFGLLEQLRGSVWKMIPVIVISAFAFGPEKKRSQSLNARQYLTKPVDLEVLIKAIQTELQKPDSPPDHFSGFYTFSEARKSELCNLFLGNFICSSQAFNPKSCIDLQHFEIEDSCCCDML